MPAVARKVATPVGTYNQKRLPILVSANRPWTVIVLFTAYLTSVICNPGLWLSGAWLCIRWEQDDPTPKHSANGQPHLFVTMMPKPAF